MTDKVQKIKEEIERRIESMNSCLFKTAELGSEKFNDGELYAYKQILQFIDSLPEEPKSEDLEEAAEKYAYNEFPSIGIPNTVIESAFKNGAEWGMNYKFRPISEDLEEAAKEYSFNIPTNQEISNDWKKETEQHFKDGAMWQKEQMMKEAVNGIMDCDDDNEWIEITDKLIVTPSRAGNKVKIIIYKPE